MPIGLPVCAIRPSLLREDALDPFATDNGIILSRGIRPSFGGTFPINFGEHPFYAFR